jgi:decaprenyl-phosphate phosphoribosyltransferase
MQNRKRSSNPRIPNPQSHLPMLTALIRLARPRDWVKNVFVLLPVPFAWKATEGKDFALTALLVGLAGFCLIASSVYTFNDLFDATTDRLHPKKRNRPIASGQVSRLAAAVQMVVLLVVGLTLCVAAERSYSVTIALLYVAVNVAYNVGAKNVPLLDVFLLSSGFVIRVLLGCALVSVPPSPWLLLCTSTLALFLGFTKRRADLKDELNLKHRPSLRGYSEAFLDQAMSICAGVAILAYALYCIEVKEILQPGRELASLPFVAYGVLNYLRMVYVEGIGASPVDVACHSLSTQACALGWLVTVTWSLGLW